MKINKIFQIKKKNLLGINTNIKQKFFTTKKKAEIKQKDMFKNNYRPTQEISDEAKSLIFDTPQQNRVSNNELIIKPTVYKIKKVVVPVNKNKLTKSPLRNSYQNVNNRYH